MVSYFLYVEVPCISSTSQSTVCPSSCLTAFEILSDIGIFQSDIVLIV